MQLVMNLIREVNSISQVDIQKTTSLSAGTVSSIVKELKDSNFLETIGSGKSAKGRKPVLIRFNPEARYVLSAVFFADQTHVAVLDLMGNIKKRVDLPTRTENGPGAVFEDFANYADRLISDTNIPRQKLLGVGVSFEGVVDPINGSLILSSHFGWSDVAVKDHIERAFGVKAFVISDGAAMALGECRYGAGRGQDDIVCIDVDTGIGAIEVSNGRIRYGSHNMAGEIGHTLTVQEGTKCKCGKTGCLETVASGWAIISKAITGLKKGTKSGISDLVYSPSTRLAIRAIFDAAGTGDEFALRVINEAGRYLGVAVAAVINYVDPELVILTGCVTNESKGMLLKIVERVAGQHVVDGRARTIRIEEGTLGENAALIGAATLVYEETFKLPVS